MEKVFWVFPKPSDDLDKWNRLDKDVKTQVRWLINPRELKHKEYIEFHESMSSSDRLLSDEQFKRAITYNQQTSTDLNDILTNYVDLKFSSIWSNDFCRKKKWELKE